MSKYNSYKVVQWCSCGASIEDDDNLFQYNKRSTLLHCIYQELNNYKNKLDLKLFHLLLDGISNYVKVITHPFIHTCQVMEEMSLKENTNNQNPYQIEYEKSFEGHHLLLSQQEAIWWNNLLCGKFSE